MKQLVSDKALIPQLQRREDVRAGIREGIALQTGLPRAPEFKL